MSVLILMASDLQYINIIRNNAYLSNLIRHFCFGYKTEMCLYCYQKRGPITSTLFFISGTFLLILGFPASVLIVCADINSLE